MTLPYEPPAGDRIETLTRDLMTGTTCPTVDELHAEHWEAVDRADDHAPATFFPHRAGSHPPAMTATRHTGQATSLNPGSLHPRGCLAGSTTPDPFAARPGTDGSGDNFTAEAA